MADDNPLHYLPPGWTEEQYRNATDEDFEGLPDDVCWSCHVRRTETVEDLVVPVATR